MPDGHGPDVHESESLDTGAPVPAYAQLPTEQRSVVDKFLSSLRQRNYEPWHVPLSDRIHNFGNDCSLLGLAANRARGSPRQEPRRSGTRKNNTRIHESCYVGRDVTLLY